MDYNESFSRLPLVDLDHQVHLERYKKFISSRPIRKFEFKKGLCRHHVWPRSFGADPSYTKEKWNIVILTEREHYIAHMILYYCYEEGMISAFFLMNHKGSNTGKYKSLTSRQFEKLRNEYSQYQSKNNIGENNPNFGNKASKETFEKMSKVHTGRVLTNEMKEKNRQSSLGRNHTKDDLIKMSNNSIYKRKVVQVETGIIYNSITDAARKTNINRKSINQVCLKQKGRKTAGGYHWEYVDYNENIKIGNRKIICLELNKIYNSVIEAAKKFNINSNIIGRVCRGQRKTAAGYHWMYLEEYKKQNIKK